MQLAKRAVKDITLIAAMTPRRVIGVAGGMPWHIPGELRHFKEATMHKAIVMGRKTWESIGRPLPGRQNIVVSRQAGLNIEGCEVARSLDEALALAASGEVMVIGGGDLFREALPTASRMILTIVDLEIRGDTYFPEWKPVEWKLVARRTVPRGDTNAIAFEVQEYQRQSAPAARSN